MMNKLNTYLFLFFQSIICSRRGGSLIDELRNDAINQLIEVIKENRSIYVDQTRKE